MSGKASNSAESHSWVVAGLLALQSAHSLRLVARFGLTGLATTLAYFLLTVVFVLLFKMAAVNSSVCAYLVSVAISYLMQSRYTFRVNGDSLDQVKRFLLISVAGLVASWCVIVFAVLMHWPYLIGAIGVCLTVPVMNFFVMRGWVFAVKQTQERKLAAGDPS